MHDFILAQLTKSYEENNGKNISCTSTMIEEDILLKLPVKYHSLVAPTLNLTEP